jgi:uncharacterized protein (DUF983 family)
MTRSELRAMIREVLKEELSRKRLNETWYSTCPECDAENKVLKHTAFGQEICSDCYEKYIHSDKGQIEVFLALIDGRIGSSKLSATELKTAADAWEKYRYELPFMYVPKKISAELRGK